MQQLRAGLLAVVAAVAIVASAGAARAQQCVVDGTPVEGPLCPSPSPTPSPSPSPSASPSPTPTRSGSPTPTPTSTGTLIVVPPIVPIPSPTIPGTFGPSLGPFPTPPQGYRPLEEGFAATRPGLPIAPTDGRGFLPMIVGTLGMSAAGAFALARARVRAWMVGI